MFNCLHLHSIYHSYNFFLAENQFEQYNFDKSTRYIFIGTLIPTQPLHSRRSKFQGSNLLLGTPGNSYPTTLLPSNPCFPLSVRLSLSLSLSLYIYIYIYTQLPFIDVYKISERIAWFVTVRFFLFESIPTIVANLFSLGIPQ